MITFNCPACMKEMNAKDEHAGKAGKCKRCGETLKVPANEVSVFDTPGYKEALKKAEKKNDDGIPRNADGNYDWYGTWCPHCKNRCSIKRKVGSLALFIFSLVAGGAVFAITVRPFYALVAFLVVLLFNFVLPNEWHCKNCQNRWRA